MKLLQTSLLIILAFTAGLVCYRAALMTPSITLAPSDDVAIGHVEQMDAAAPRIVLASAPSETADVAEEAVEADIAPAAPQPETFDVAEPADTFEADIEIQGVTSFDIDAPDPSTQQSETTIKAVPDGSRVQVSSDEYNVEADEIRLRSPRSRTADFDNPIPEFLRGRDLPPLLPGQKVVTIKVPVENWVDLGWGDLVKVHFEQAPTEVRQSDGSVVRKENFRLPVCDAEIYALPAIAPEQGDTVPVCLKLTVKAAREMLAIRKNPGTYTLTVTNKHQRLSQTYEESAFSTDAVPRLPVPIAAHDDFAPQRPQPEPLPATDAVPEPVPTYRPGRATDDFAPARRPDDNGEPDARDATDDRLPFVDPPHEDDLPGSPTPQPTIKPGPTYSPEPDDFDLPARPVNEPADNTPVPIGSHDDFSVPAHVEPVTEPVRDELPMESLPTIEPSGEGTVMRMLPDRQFVVGAGQSIHLEYYPIKRVWGFDSKIIRVTAEGPQELKVEGLHPGTTAFRVSSADGVFAPFDMTITVEGPPPYGLNTHTVESPVGNNLPLDQDDPRRDVATRADDADPVGEPRIAEVTADSPPDPLPTIEPSEEGTVHRIDGAGSYVVDSGDVLLFETPLPVQKVSGFDARVIRVTAESPRRLKVEGVTAGETAMIVRLAKNVFPAFDVQVTVHGRTPGVPLSEQEAMSKQQEELLRQQTRHDEVKLILSELYPDADLKPIWIHDSLLLRGTVGSEQDKTEITEIATQFAPRVLNQLKVAEPDIARPEAHAAPSRPQSRLDSDTRIVVLTFDDVTQLQRLKVGNRVDVHRIRTVRNHGKVEAEETRMATNAMVSQVHIAGHNGLLTLEVSADVAERLSEADTSTLQIHLRTTKPTRQVPVVVTNSEEELQQLNPGDRVNVLRVRRPPVAASLNAVTEELIVGDARLIRAEISNPKLGNDRVVVLELSAEQAAAIFNSGEQPLTIQVPPRSRPTPTEAPSPPEPVAVSRNSLQDDIRALHEDVRKLITLLEHRLSDHSHGHDHGHGDAPFYPGEPSSPQTFDSPIKPEPSTRETVDEPTETESPTEANDDDRPQPPVDREAAAFLERVWHFVGVRFTPVGGDAPLLKEQYVPGGLRIDEVRPDSPLARADLQPGHVIIGVRDWQTTDAAGLKYALDQTAAQGVWEFEFHIVRDNRQISTHVPLQWKELKPPPADPPMQRQPEQTTVDRARPSSTTGAAPCSAASSATPWESSTTIAATTPTIPSTPASQISPRPLWNKAHSTRRCWSPPSQHGPPPAA